VFLVFAATNSHDVNARIAADATGRNVWINRADTFAGGDFIVPAVVRNGDLCLSISTGGNQPLLTARIASELQDRFGPDFGDYVELLGQMRSQIKAQLVAPDMRRKAMGILMEAEPVLRALLQSGRAASALTEAQRLVDEFAASTVGVNAEILSDSGVLPRVDARR
jgi:precorrin-2 dehydrogenase/sirohydrochlorin ferrochelatase